MAVVLIWLVILAVSNIDMFSKGYLLSAERRSRLQNELCLVADDICKNVAQAPGDLTGAAVIKTGADLIVKREPPASPATFTYTLTNYKIQKNLNNLNILPAITSFVFNPLDNGIGVELNIAGRYDPALSVSPNNPEASISTKCYSHQASAR